MITDEELFEWIAEIAARTCEVAEQAGPDVEIQGCPGWTVTDLLAHVGPFYSGFYTHNLTMSMADADFIASHSSAPPVPDAFADRLDYVRVGSASFLDAARAADLDANVWVWGEEGPARSWVNRTATEMAVHCWDLEQSVGDVRRVSGPRGATSVEEHHSVMLQMLIWIDGDTPGIFHHPAIPDRPIGIGVVDADADAGADAAWTLSHDGDGAISFTSTPELPETSVRGTGHDLMLYQYGRLPLSELEVRGDSDLLTSWNWFGRDVYKPVE